MQDPSRICDLHRSSWQRRILNPLREARDRTSLLMDTRRLCYHWAAMGTPRLGFLLGSVLLSKKPGRSGTTRSGGEGWGQAHGAGARGRAWSVQMFYVMFMSTKEHLPPTRCSTAKCMQTDLSSRHQPVCVTGHLHADRLDSGHAISWRVTRAFHPPGLSHISNDPVTPLSSVIIILITAREAICAHRSQTGNMFMTFAMSADKFHSSNFSWEIEICKMSV